MTDIPPHFLARPPLPADPATLGQFDALFEAAVAAGPGEPIDYHLEAPRWQFISHVVERHGLIAHGSQNPAIERFEPRRANHAHAFGDRTAVYGASDGLWAMFYAILDRPAHPMLIVNSAARIELDDQSLSDPFYFFSISRPALLARAFRAGTLYFLPRDTFEPMPPVTVNGMRTHVPQWASLVPVIPLARIEVRPDDFPFLGQIRAHDDETILASAKADPDGFPWLD